MADGKPVGYVTFMANSPRLRKPIALAYVPPGLAVEGTRLSVATLPAATEMKVTRIPFYDPDGTRIRV
jgi:aminomethyltransferase